MIGAELYKLFKRKLVWEVLLGIFILMGVSELYLNSYYFYGGHYHELQEEIELCEKYKGVLTDERLENFLEERWGDFYKKYPDQEYNYLDAFFDAEGNEIPVDSGLLFVKNIFPDVHFPIQFGYYEGWALFLNQLPRYMRYISIFIAVAYSALFSYERECGMQEILACAKEGRGDCVKAKITGAFLVTNTVYLIMTLIPCMIAFFLYKGKGLNTSIQMTPWIRNSQLEMNYGTLLLHTFFLSFISINVILLIALTAAFLAKSPLKSMCITFAILFVISPDFVTRYMGNTNNTPIIAMTPVNVTNTLNLANQMPINIGNLKIHWLTIAEMIYSILLICGSAILFWKLPKKG